jgi:hypothetical protein
MRNARSATRHSMVVATLFAAAFLGAAVARAADRKVVVEQFSGPQSDDLRKLVQKSLKGTAGVDIVSDKKLAAAEADLGLMQASDAYEAVAKQLGASAFISGKVSGKKALTAVITVRDGTGKKLGTKKFTGKGKQLTKAAEKGLPGALADLLGADGGGAAQASKEQAKEDKTADEAGEETADAEEKPARASRKDREEKAREEKAEVAGRQEESEKEAEAEPADEDVSEEELAAAEANDDSDGDLSDSIEGPKKKGAFKRLDLTAGALIYNRDFKYNQLQGDSPKAYNLPLGPAAAVAADFYLLPFLGLTAGGDFSFGLTSERDGAKFATSAMSFFGGAKGRLTFGPLETYLTATVGKQNFDVAKSAEDGDGDEVNSEVETVDYTFARAGVGGRFDIGKFFAVTAGFGYVHVLSLGGITDTFGGATAAATDGHVGGALPLHFVPGLEARASVYFRQYALDMNSKSGDDVRAGGATDRYVGLNVGLALRM